MIQRGTNIVLKDIVLTVQDHIEENGVTEIVGTDVNGNHFYMALERGFKIHKDYNVVEQRFVLEQS
jgi:hypothetical protein